MSKAGFTNLLSLLSVGCADSDICWKNCVRAVGTREVGRKRIGRMGSDSECSTWRQEILKEDSHLDSLCTFKAHAIATYDNNMIEN